MDRKLNSIEKQIKTMDKNYNWTAPQKIESKDLKRLGNVFLYEERFK